EERKFKLDQLSEILLSDISQGKTPKLISICTHNSRRSHLLQIMLSYCFDYLELPDISTFSGGTEATAFNPNAINALKMFGFLIEQKTFEDNPNYDIIWGKNGEKSLQNLHSKNFRSKVNP